MFTKNIKYKSIITPVKVLLLFYLIIATNYTKHLYSGQLEDFLKNNRIAQHVVGLLLLLILMIEYGGIDNLWTGSIYSLLLYILFVFSTKLDLKWSLAICGLLIIATMSEFVMKKKEVESFDDESLEEEDLQKIKNNNSMMNTIFIVSILVVIFIGFFYYKQKKMVQYGGKFNKLRLFFDGNKLKM